MGLRSPLKKVRIGKTKYLPQMRSQIVSIIVSSYYKSFWSSFKFGTSALKILSLFSVKKYFVKPNLKKKITCKFKQNKIFTSNWIWLEFRFDVNILSNVGILFLLDLFPFQPGFWSKISIITFIRIYLWIQKKKLRFF